MNDSVSIVRALAEGFDPRTGEVFGEEGPWSDPKIIRALYRAADALERTRGERRSPRILPAGAGQPWTPEEEERLKEEYGTTKDIAALAGLHERTPHAISSRLVRLGLLPPPERPVSAGS